MSTSYVLGEVMEYLINWVLLDLMLQASWVIVSKNNSNAIYQEICFQYFKIFREFENQYAKMIPVYFNF